jgi:hypothetical protein
MIVYNDITYFTMTWNFSRALGLKMDWQNESGLSIGKTTETEKLDQDLSANNDLNNVYKANIADFNIKLNDEVLNNAEEQSPSNFQDECFEVTTLERGRDGDFVYIKIVYYSPEEQSVIGMRIGPDELELRNFVREEAIVKEGYNVFIFRVNESMIITAESSIQLELGDDNSYQVKYDLIVE